MSEVVKSVSIAALVNQRAAVIERINQALALLQEAEQIAHRARLKFPRVVLDDSYAVRGRGVSVTGPYSSPDEARSSMLQSIDKSGWNYLLEESGLRTFMDAAARSRWADQLDKGDIPELTADNITATFGQLHEARGDMFERGVIECFRRLSWNYRSNEPFKFGKRIIVSNLFAYGFPSRRATDELDDLMRVFHVLDGKPEPDHREGMQNQIMAAHRERQATEFENDYIRVKWFKKGTGHVYFKRPALVERMNAILVKHYPNALPAEKRR